MSFAALACLAPCLCLVALLLPASPVFAQAENPAVQWLQKIYTATQKLSYTGTFVYQQGATMEMSRISRYVDASGAHEKLEALEGGVREVIRSAGQVTYYLPSSMTVKVERQILSSAFPAVLPVQFRELNASYTVSIRETERVAGFECQVIMLEPRDQLRYGHKLWANVKTGMLLKSQAFNERHEPIETFAFTQLQIGNVDRDKVRASFAAHPKDWRVENSDSKVASLENSGWTIRAPPPGFRKIGEMRRNVGNVSDVGQIVLSDGMAAVSIFIEPVAGRQTQAVGVVRPGPINVVTRKIGDYLITVVGETPAEGVKFIANAVEYRKP